jgi:hypothetical protein
MLLNPGDNSGSPLSKPGSVLMANADGVLQWHENRPVPASWVQQWYTPGTSGTQYVLSLTGTGAAQAAIATDDALRHAGEIETGTTTTGRAALFSGATPALTPVAGQTLTFEALVAIPTLPVSGGDDYTAAAGFVNAASTLAGGLHGVRFMVSSASANWQLQIFGATTTTHDTGIACTAGVWYRIRIVISGTGASSGIISYIVRDDDYYANGRDWGTPVSTDSVDLSSFSVYGHVGIAKSSGTTSRQFYVGFINTVRIPPRSVPLQAELVAFASNLNPADGVALPQALAGQTLLVDSTGKPYWGDYLIDTDNTPFWYYDHGGIPGTLVSNIGGSGASISRLGFAGLPPASFDFSGTTATGFARRELEASVYPISSIPPAAGIGVPYELVCESVFTTPGTLSNATNTYYCQLGFLPATSGLGTYAGAWLEFDPNTDTHFRLAVIYKHGEINTTTYFATTLTVATNTTYWVRIVWTPGTGVTMKMNVIGSSLDTGVSATAPQLNSTDTISAGRCTTGHAITNTFGGSGTIGRFYIHSFQSYLRVL